MSKFDLKKYLKETEELVNIDSFSKDPEGVNKVGKIFSEMFKSLGGWTVRHAVESKTAAPCIEIFNKTDKHFDIFMLGHIDTVFPAGTVAKRPYSEKDGRLYGPGVYDMKTGVLSAYYALKELQEEGKLDNLSICLGLNTEEELGSRNAREWIENTAKKSDYAIICEPARVNGEMVTERKGLGRLKIEIQGKASHAGINPQGGISAILIIADWIKEIHSLTDYNKGTTLNVGLVSGGTGVNTVPPYASCEVDIRIDDPAEYERITAKLEELKEKTKKTGAESVVTGGLTRPVLRGTDKTWAFVKLVDAEAEKLGFKITWIKTGGGSDGNFTGAMGVPTLDGFGPVGSLSHTDNEYVDIDSIEPRMLLLKNTIAKIGELKK